VQRSPRGEDTYTDYAFIHTQHVVVLVLLGNGLPFGRHRRHLLRVWFGSEHVSTLCLPLQFAFTKRQEQPRQKKRRPLLYPSFPNKVHASSLAASCQNYCTCSLLVPVDSKDDGAFFLPSVAMEPEDTSDALSFALETMSQRRTAYNTVYTTDSFRPCSQTRVPSTFGPLFRVTLARSSVGKKCVVYNISYYDTGIGT